MTVLRHQHIEIPEDWARELKEDMSIEITSTVLRNLQGHFTQNDWLGSANSYRIDCIHAISQLRKDVRVFQGSELPEYITASAPLHCLDGWAYLSRALDAHLTGDAHTARHLAYYAELRAAMSILATYGVGIFLNRHFVVKDCDSVRDISLGRDGKSKPLATHAMTHVAYGVWATSDQAKALLLESISAFGASLGDWLQGSYNVMGDPSGAVSYKWWEALELDVARMAKDHLSRNTSSYRPTFFHSSGSLDAGEAVTFLLEFWRSLEPSDHGTFDELDKFLVRRSLEWAFEHISEVIADDESQDESTSETRNHDNSALASRIHQVVDVVLADKGLLAQEAREFFSKQSSSEYPSIIRRALGNADIMAPGQHLEMISRAALLLRLASAACLQLFRRAGVSPIEASFWWLKLGADHGLWDPAHPPESLTELWADIETAIEDIQEKRARDGSLRLTYFDAKRDYASALVALKECELVGLWSLGL